MGNQKYEAFLKAAETGSFKQTAQELGYTQAGVSYLINALERELGLSLFVREYGGVRLSADGENLLPWIQNVSTSERQLEMHLADLKHLESGIVRVASFTSTAIQWFPGITKAFLAQYPNIDVQLISLDDESELEATIWRGDADCGFLVYPISYDLEVIPLRRDPLLIVLSPDHPLAGEKRFPHKALVEEPYILLRSGSISEMDTLFSANDAKPNIRFTIDSDYAVMSMVNAGLGFSVLPELILRNAPFPLVTMPAEVDTSREIAIAQRSSETASAATKTFIEFTQTWVQEAYKTH